MSNNVLRDFSNLNDNLKRIIYEFDPTYTHKFNTVLEELKLFRLFKFKPQYNLQEPIKWTERISKTEPNQNDTIIHFNKKYLRLLKDVVKHDITMEFLKALLKQKEATTYFITVQLQPTPTAYGVSLFKIVNTQGHTLK